MNEIKAKIEFNGEELWDLKAALKHDLDNSLEWANKHDCPARVFKLNAERKLNLYLKVAPLVDSYQSIQATLSKYPLDEFKSIK